MCILWSALIIFVLCDVAIRYIHSTTGAVADKKSVCVKSVQNFLAAGLQVPRLHREIAG